MLPIEQPTVLAVSPEPVPSFLEEQAAAAPKPDALDGESHSALNSVRSDPIYRSGLASSTSASRQSTVVAGVAPSASADQPLTATERITLEAAAESVASTYPAADLDDAEKRAVPIAFSAPLAPSNVMSDVASSVLTWLGLSPFVPNQPLAPVNSPALWAVLAWARRQNQQTLIDETPPVIKTLPRAAKPSTVW